jgi:glutamate racemase
MKNRPIGIFDSGIGGLTVAKAVNELFPEESIIYLGDTARVPYGTRSKETIVKYSLNNLAFLEKENIKLLVIACNTASAFALAEVSEATSIPVIGVVEGGVRVALATISESAKEAAVGVIGTEATIRSACYETAIRQKNSSVAVFSKACPMFVSLVEEGWVDDDIAKLSVDRYLSEMRGKVSSLVLGCTHYPLLKNVIGDYMGGGVKLVDSASETARLVGERLVEENLENRSSDKKFLRLLLTDSPERSEKMIKLVWGDNLAFDQIEQIDLK